MLTNNLATCLLQVCYKLCVFACVSWEYIARAPHAQFCFNVLLIGSRRESPYNNCLSYP